ncbi:MAG TPA: gluconeogenesis factor YvcK family protein [Anaerolineales bacterium]|jgi:uncharacterized cofD-like protein
MSKQGENGRPNGRWRLFWRWFQPGLGVKRWLLVIVAGTALIGLGLAILLLDYYRTHPDATWLYILSLRAFPRWLRAVFLGGAGLGLLLVAVFRLNRSLLAPYVSRGRPLVEMVAEHRRLGRGPRIVAVGGGHGLATLLRGLKHHTTNLTAVVTMADDGGSSGRLRRSLGLPPPGDVRNCLAALSDDEQLLTQLFQYRFRKGEELEGHSFGNLFIAALAGVTGSFDRGLLEAARVLTIRGRVLPSTLADVALLADKLPVMDVHAVRVEGESRIPGVPGRIRRVYLEPNEPPAYPLAIQALLNAEMIVLGPGSLYTSLLPNLLVPDIPHAVRASRAFKVYVCNVATQPGETDGYDCSAHVRAIEEHVGSGLIDLVLANDVTSPTLPPSVTPVTAESNGNRVPVHSTDLVDDVQPWRHDAAKLAETLIALLEERTGPLELPTLDEIEARPGLN